MMECNDRLSLADAQKWCLEKNTAFYSYRIPGDTPRFGAQPNGEVGIFDSFSTLENLAGFIVYPYEITPATPPLFIKEELCFTGECRDRNVIEQLSRATSTVPGHQPQENKCSRKEYLARTGRLISALQKGEARKTVLSRRIDVPGNAFAEAPELFRLMTDAYSEAFVFLVFIPGVTCWMGATPETFLRQDATTLRTMALAGTQSAGENGTCGPWENKDKEEQQIVSDYIRHILNGMYGKNVKENGPFTQKAGGIFHLCTTFECTEKPNREKADNICRLLHPTPAVCGTPKADAQRLIRETESHARRYYAGFLGPVKRNGEFDLFVNLRSMELFPDCSQLYVGGGITALSDPEKEWEETVAKSRTILNLKNNERK